VYGRRGNLVRVVREVSAGRRVLRVNWRFSGKRRVRTLPDTQENRSAVMALIAAVTNGRDVDLAIPVWPDRAGPLNPTPVQITGDMWGDAELRGQFQMTEEQWSQMRERFRRAHQEHAEQATMLYERYARALFTHALELCAGKREPPPRDSPD
jgi:hypothetical protein